MIGLSRLASRLLREQHIQLLLLVLWLFFRLVEFLGDENMLFFVGLFDLFFRFDVFVHIARGELVQLVIPRMIFMFWI